MNFEGNTLPYNMYAYARINSIFEKDGIDMDEMNKCVEKFEVLEDIERDLCLILLSYPEVIGMTFKTMMFHYLCRYVYSLTSTFHKFFFALKCLEYSDGKLSNINYNRLIMLKITLGILENSFNILGINPIKQM